MDIFKVLTMLGGLALFLYGMSTMGDGLVMLSGGKLEQILEKLTSKRIMALLLGTLVTAVIQSSSATTVMVVGFVNSGIMKLSQAVGIIMGANIGTTITSWILSLSGISSGNVFIKLLKPSSFSPVLALIGIICLMTSKDGEKKKTIGNILLGFAVLMFGMETMSGAVAPLKENAAFTGMLTMFSNPILGMIAGADRCDSELFCIRRNPPGPMHFRCGYLWNRYSYYYGTEYRYLCDGTDLVGGCQQKCEAGGVYSSVF